MSLILRNARITDSRRERNADVLVNDGRISGIGTVLPLGGARVIDCEGLTLMPSFVDLHAHFRDPGQTAKETIETGARAAVHGGYTFVNLMPNTMPVCSDMETVRYVRREAERIGLCDVHQTISITKDFDGATLSHLEKIDEDVKWLSDDGNGVNNLEILYNAMLFARDRGIGLMLHEEERFLTPIDSYLAEDIPTARDVKLAALTGCKTHFCHVSTIQSMKAVIAAKKHSENITCEVSPHHLALNDNTAGNVAPPLRGEEHRAFLVQCVKDGYVDAIATDHAPHTPEDKARGINGFTGLDLAFATCYTALVRTGIITLGGLSGLMSYNPARFMGLDGYLVEEGLPANLVLADLKASFTASEKHIHSKSPNTPMLGKNLCGKIMMTIRKGEIVYENRN